MKTYSGQRFDHGCEVKVFPIGVRMIYSLPLGLEVANHSPTGFDWGYGGSGPAQLALALLLDHTSNPMLATSAYQDFKFQVVGRMPKKGWTLTGAEIDMWLARSEADRAKWDYFAQKWDGVREEMS